MLFTFIVGVDDGAETFLSSSVPYLQFDYFLVDIDGLEPEVNADGDHVVLVKIVVGETQQQRTFTHCGVADHDKFEQMIVLLALHFKSIIRKLL